MATLRHTQCDLPCYTETHPVSCRMIEWDLVGGERSAQRNQHAELRGMRMPRAKDVDLGEWSCGCTEAGKIDQ